MNTMIYYLRNNGTGKIRKLCIISSEQMFLKKYNSPVITEIFPPIFFRQTCYHNLPGLGHHSSLPQIDPT